MNIFVEFVLAKRKIVTLTLTFFYLVLLLLFSFSSINFKMDFDIPLKESNKISELTGSVESLGEIAFLGYSKEIEIILDEYGIKGNDINTDNLNILAIPNLDKKNSTKLYADVVRYNKCSNCNKIGLNGPIASENQVPKANFAEIIGVLAALLILFFTFGNIFTALIPIVLSLLALLGSFLALGPVSQVISIPAFAPMMMSLLALGVGIDYSLFIISRFKDEFSLSRDINISIINSFKTSGKAILYAGFTVIISLLGILLTKIGFLNGLAISSAIGVLFTLILNLTLLPILLLKFNGRILRSNSSLAPVFWDRWANLIKKRGVSLLFFSSCFLVLLSSFLPSLRMGGESPILSDKSSPSFHYANILSSTGNIGLIDPYIALVPNDKANQFLSSIDSEYKIFDVKKLSDFSLIKLGGDDFSHTKESAKSYEKLSFIVKTNQGFLSGKLSIFAEISNYVKEKLLYFLFIVLGISFLFISLVYRSLFLGLITVLSNLFVASASFGFLSLVFQHGLLSFIGISGDTPILAFLPVLFLAILFGLAMDYQVFYLSRVAEEFRGGKSTSESSLISIKNTGKVITSAALIMIVVFVSFSFSTDLNIKMAGIGLASSIFLDAFIMRNIVIPVTLMKVGDRLWYFPKSLDKILPKFDLE